MLPLTFLYVVMPISNEVNGNWPYWKHLARAREIYLLDDGMARYLGMNRHGLEWSLQRDASSLKSCAAKAP